MGLLNRGIHLQAQLQRQSFSVVWKTGSLICSGSSSPTDSRSFSNLLVGYDAMVLIVTPGALMGAENFPLAKYTPRILEETNVGRTKSQGEIHLHSWRGCLGFQLGGGTASQPAALRRKHRSATST